MCNPSVEPDSRSSSGPPTMLQRLSDAVDASMKKFFGDLGESLGKNPRIYICAAFLMTVACGGGFAGFTNERRPEKLWIPQGTTAQDDSDRHNSVFENPFRVAYIIGEPKSGNMLSKDNLVNLMKMHDKIEAIQVEDVEDASITWDLNSLCFQMDSDGHPCFINSVLQYWDYDLATLEADDDVQTTLQSADIVDLQGFLGGFKDNTASGGGYTAKAAKISYFIENRQVVVNGDYEDLPAETWEEEYLLVAEKCVPGLECYYIAARSFGDAFGAAIGGDVIAMNMGFLIIITYLCVNLSGKCCDFLESKVMLSLVSILSIGLAIASSMGLSQYCGWAYTPVHTVLPFVLLGLGVDDSFVIMNSFEQTSPTAPIEERMRDAMSHAGVSITVTSMTDFVAFIISTSTSLPALSSFCFYAATGILFLFIYQCILFGAMVVLDARRVEKRKLDCCLGGFWICTAKVDPEVDAKRAERVGKPGRVTVFMKETFGPFVVNKSVAPVIAVISIIMLGVGAWGASQLTVESNQLNFVPDDSYIQDTFRVNDDLFGGDGTSVSLVMEEFDYFAEQSEIYAVKAALNGKAHLESTDTAFDSWYHEFVGYNAAGCYGACLGSNAMDSEGLPADETQFYANLNTFLSSAGARFASSVVFNDDGSIKASKVGLTYDPKINDNAALQVEAMTQLRDEVDKFSFPAFPYTYSYLTWETFIVIESEMISNVSLCMAAVFVITLILIAQPLTAGLVFFCVGCAIIEILGTMYFWDLVIDNVSVINLTLAVGLAVDYSAHVGHCFMVKPGSNNSERVIAALEDIGAAVLNGAISTFLAVVVLSGSKSYVFRVLFKQFFLTCTFGVFNGMVFLPVLLMYFGPAPYASASHHGENDKHQHELVTVVDDKGADI